MIDTHCHLDVEQFNEDREEVLARAISSGVEHIIIPAIRPSDFQHLLSITNQSPHLSCGLGVHPHNASEFESDTADVIKQLYEENTPKVKALGEIGLDYYYDFAPKSQQQAVFHRQLELAKELNLPVIIHNRDSDEDVLSIVKEHQDEKLRGVFHCFSSSPEYAEKVLDAGFHISFTGNVTYKKSTLAECIQLIPEDRIMIETDSPYMAPVPYRGKRNEPSYVQYIAHKIAEIRSTTVETMIQQTTKNAASLFAIFSLLLFFIATDSFSQRGRIDFEDEKETDIEILEHPYPKLIGIGALIGSNTIVDNLTFLNGCRKGKDQWVSLAAIAAYGAQIMYYPVEWIQLEAGFNTSSHQSSLFTNAGEPPIIDSYRNIDFAFKLIPNQYGRINFFAGSGVSISSATYGSNNETVTRIGPILNVGLMGNIDFSWGVIVPSAEFRVNFPTGARNFTSNTIDPGSNIYDCYRNEPEQRAILDVNTILAIPRFTISIFPKF